MIDQTIHRILCFLDTNIQELSSTTESCDESHDIHDFFSMNYPGNEIPHYNPLRDDFEVVSLLIICDTIWKKRQNIVYTFLNGHYFSLKIWYQGAF